MDYLNEENAYDDFFGLNDIRNEISKCNYCGKNIALMPFTCNELCFCDVICCKLYGDDNGWKHYNYDKHTYDLYYKNQLLSSSAMVSYKILRKVDLPLLPRYNDAYVESKEIMKNKYLDSLISYITYVF